MGYLVGSHDGYPTLTLTVARIRNTKPREKPYKLYDGKGLYLHVMPTGSKLWKLKYTLAKREKCLSFGPFPETTLAAARRKRTIARQMLAEGIDPSKAKKEKREAHLMNEATFEVVAKEWLADRLPSWAPSHSSKVARRLERDVYPRIGSRPINEIGARELLVALRKIVDRGAIETAHRTKQACGQVFRYAVATGRADRDVSQDLRGALPQPVRRHLASITDPDEIGGLLRAIDSFSGYEITKLALQLAPFVFVRPGELRGAEWHEFDLEEGLWRISGDRMKTRKAHLVQLSTQSRSILCELHELTGGARLVFPSVRTRDRSISENTLTGALRRLGYTSEEMTAHGFRSMASTLLNELGWNRDAIERQLAHAERDSVRAAYNYAEHLPLRRKMMQSWGDYLDGLKNGVRVVPIRRSGAWE